MVYITIFVENMGFLHIWGEQIIGYFSVWRIENDNMANTCGGPEEEAMPRQRQRQPPLAIAA